LIYIKSCMLRIGTYLLLLVACSLHAQQYPPTKLTAHLHTDSVNRQIKITWQQDFRDSTSVGYYLFIVDESGKKELVASLGIIHESETSYPIKGKKAGRIRFCVASMTNYPDLQIGECSSIVEIDYPSLWIPAPGLCRQTDHRLSWKYPPIPDLKSFYVEYLRDGLKADTTLNSSARELHFTGTIKKPRIQAMTHSGVRSTKSSFWSYE